MVKIKPGWQFAPDKLEQWLEEMERQGYNLFRIDWGGIRFSFTRGRQRQVKYCVDFQRGVDKKYYDIHQEAGWEPVYLKRSRLLGESWTIWAKEYTGDGEPPSLYSDSHNTIKHARRVAIYHSCFFIPLGIILSMGIVLSMNFELDLQILFEESMLGLPWISFTLRFLAILLCFNHTLKGWLYYHRVKNSTRVDNY